MGSFLLPTRLLTEGGGFCYNFYLGYGYYGFSGWKLNGRTPLAPQISPKKTVEGAIGGLTGSTLTGLILACFFPLFFTAIYRCLGLATGVIGSLGDLTQSALKRSAGAKDSGDLPGHGGILDRFDSLFCSPFIIFVLPNFLIDKMEERRYIIGREEKCFNVHNPGPRFIVTQTLRVIDRPWIGLRRGVVNQKEY